jgi:hypothetical protein
LLTDHQTQPDEAVECLADLANGDGDKRKALLQVGNEVRRREAGPRGAGNDPTRLTVVTGNDTDPEGHLFEAEGLERSQGNGNGWHKKVAHH